MKPAAARSSRRRGDVEARTSGGRDTCLLYRIPERAERLRARALHGGPHHGGSSTAVGFEALRSNTTGGSNTAIGRETLESNTAGSLNTALGSAVTTGSNIAIGHQALTAATTVNQQVAIGRLALGVLVGPSGQNTAVGDAAFEALTAGSSNIAIGAFAGGDLTTGSRNIYVGTAGGVASESDTIRIGTPVFTEKVAAYVGGIYNRAVNVLTDQPVLVDSTGKLGTMASTERVKQDIHTLDDVSALHRLRPVSFRYRPDQGRGDAVQYGLIAEQVADVMPELVVRDAQGQPISVRYHLLAPLLLAEVQRLERERAALVSGSRN